jgi:MFS family permease
MNSAKTTSIAAATAVIVLPLFAPPPLVGAIGASLHFPYWAVNTPATVTLLGYAMGLFLVTPLIDLVELRRLVVTTVVADAAALTVAALAPRTVVFLCAAFLVGVMTSTIQMLVPLAAMLARNAVV